MSDCRFGVSPVNYPDPDPDLPGVDSLQCWERACDMEVNPSKCQVLHISRYRSPIKSNYYMHGQELETVESAKYLMYMG